MELQWPLILFTTLLAWAAGVFGAQCLYALRGQGTRAQMPALITSAALLVVGGIAVFFHLEHWERIFNGFGHLTSGITQELIAIIVLFVAMVVYFVYLRRGGDDAKVPAWLSAIGIVVAAVLVIVMGHSYMMASLPAWDSVLQIGSLLGAACGFGPATMAVLCAVKDESLDYTAKVNVIGQIVNVVLVVAYLVAMQATAMAPVSISEADCPAEVVEHERKIAVEAMKQDPKNANKPEAILEKIAEGKMRKFFEENTLLAQPVVGEKESIADFIHKADKEATVIAYKRFALGE